MLYVLLEKPPLLFQSVRRLRRFDVLFLRHGGEFVFFRLDLLRLFQGDVRLDIDPFFTPKTEEEREEFGEDGDVGPNMARQLVDATRRRKGLKVEETLVKVATKQRTLSRKA